MNSMAQQAVPNGSGQSELPRAQLTIVSSVVVRYVPPARSSVSFSASPGRVISPFSAPSPGATPGLRGMMVSGCCTFSVGITRRLRRADSTQLTSPPEKRLQTFGDARGAPLFGTLPALFAKALAQLSVAEDFDQPLAELDGIPIHALHDRNSRGHR